MAGSTLSWRPHAGLKPRPASLEPGVSDASAGLSGPG